MSDSKINDRSHGKISDTVNSDTVNSDTVTSDTVNGDDDTPPVVNP